MNYYYAPRTRNFTREERRLLKKRVVAVALGAAIMVAMCLTLYELYESVPNTRAQAADLSYTLQKLYDAARW